MKTATAPALADAYDRIFLDELKSVYPEVEAIEDETGYALTPERYLPAARVLACPLKVHPPNWQHGRVLYAMARTYLQTEPGFVTMLDIGTAKGYSALCLLWALNDAGNSGCVNSVDVRDPDARVKRNSVMEVDGLKTLAEFLQPWPEAGAIKFRQSTGIDWLRAHNIRVHVAFVDGKHDADVVRKEGTLLADKQEAGDLVMFDDVQIPGVAAAVQQLDGYELRYVDVLPNRRYAIGRRR